MFCECACNEQKTTKNNRIMLFCATLGLIMPGKIAIKLVFHKAVLKSQKINRFPQNSDRVHKSRQLHSMQ